jgi:hypothetical protein
VKKAPSSFLSAQGEKIAVPPDFMDNIHLVYAYNGAHRRVLISIQPFFPNLKGLPSHIPPMRSHQPRTL